MSDQNVYFNLRQKSCSENIDTIFPGWTPGEERLAVFSPHDDDALIGAGYAMDAALQAGAEVYVLIFSKGDCGYSRLDQKDTIVATRARETASAYLQFGLPADHVLRFDYPDFSVSHFVGHRLSNGDKGSLFEIIRFIRDKKITRVMIPNGYREHTDHTAVFTMAANDVIQAGDSIMAEIGAAQSVKNLLQYSVWADFSPEDQLTTGEQPGIRANRAVVCPQRVETRVNDALMQFASQLGIIRNLMASRKERYTGQGYLELYIEFDPRPKLDFSCYLPRIQEILKTAAQQ